MLLNAMVLTLPFFIIITYQLSNRDYLSAPVVLCVTFFIAAIMCEPYVYKWYFNMSTITFEVLMVGILSFLIGYYVILHYKENRSGTLISEPATSVFFISWQKTWLFLLLQVFVIFISWRYINEIATIFNMTDSISQKIIAYRLSVISNDGTLNIPPIPKVMAYSRKFAYIGSLFFVYRMAAIRAIEKKWDKKSILVMVFTIFICLMEGSRGAILLHIVFPFVVVFYIYRLRVNRWKNHFTLRKFFIYGIIAFVGMIVFYASLVIIGRGDDIEITKIGNLVSESVENLAIYLGAELKLLDVYLTQEYYPGTSIFLGEHTFRDFYAWLYNKLGITIVNNDFGFRTVNGVFLGNVYTMFKPYYIDAGMIGVICFSLIMGAFFGYVYYKVRYTQKPYNAQAIDVWLLVYAYIYYSVALAFFSNWFYNEISITLLQSIFSYFIFKWIFIRGVEALKEKDKAVEYES